jgi:hypothetical protein
MIELGPDEKPITAAPAWQKSPATVIPIKSIQEFENKANEFFEDCLIREERPTITGLALAVGLPGPTTLLRLGQRIPELRYSLSRCITAIAHGYEQMIGAGQATGPMFMLKNLPDFDPEEPDGEPAVLFFNDRKEITLTTDIAGRAVAGDEFDDVDPLDVYLSVIKKPIRNKASNKPLLEGKVGHPARPSMFRIIEQAEKEVVSP